MATVLEEVDRNWNKQWADEIFNVIMEEIDKFFN